MKRTTAAAWAAATAALLLIPLLAGCGTVKDPAADTHTDNPTQRELMHGPARSAKRAVEKSGSTFGNSFSEMLENGRVHDTDGDLTDGENSVREPW